MARENDPHVWRFARTAGFDQVRIDSGEDLLSLGELDQKLWIALACPVDGLALDRKTLALIDTDGDGRIRAPELLAAVSFAAGVLKDPGTLTKGSSKLALSALNDTPEAKRLAASARQILKNLGKKGAGEITLEEASDTAAIFADTRFNGDGVVSPAAAEDDADLRKAIEDVLKIMGPVKDLSGEDGVDQDRVDKFFAEAEAYVAWQKAAAADAGRVLPLGDATGAAALALEAVRAKVDDYFMRVRLVSFDDRAGAPLNRDPAEYASISGDLLSEKIDKVAAFPLARVEASRPLPLRAGVNPAWAARVRELEGAVVAPLLGERDALTQDDWTALCDRLAPYEAWRAAKAGALVEPLGEARARELLDGDFKAKITALIEKDRALEPQAKAIGDVEKLLRLNRDLDTLVNNFVSFRDFYSRKKAVFQAGTLYIDGRSCDLCVRVADPGAHAALAARSGTYIVYCEVRRKGSTEKMNIAAAVTDGDEDNLTPGKNGLFYDRDGGDWDATIVKVLESPISVRQAFWAPYKRIGRLVEQQIEKIAAARDKAVDEKAATDVAASGAAVDKPAAPGAKPAAPFDIAKFAGIFAAIGLALAAIGAAIGSIASSFIQLTWWQMILVVLGILLLISGSSMILAYLKLRKRNIGPILDGAGWAVNTRARLNLPFGTALTKVAELPRGAQRSMDDPYEERRRPWWLYAALLLLIGAGIYFWRTGQLRQKFEELTAPPPAAPAAPSASGAPAAPQ